MRNKLLIAVLIFIVTEGFVLMKSAKAAVTFKQAKHVFQLLENVSGQHAVLKLDEDVGIDAYTTQNGIFINQGMLNFMNSDSELAAVLGHELTHWTYQDYRLKDSSFALELRADKHGVELCRKLKYKDCLAFSKHALKMLPNPRDGVHPDWDIRFRSLKHAK